jgi:hypothetical protein
MSRNDRVINVFHLPTLCIHTRKPAKSKIFAKMIQMAVLDVGVCHQMHKMLFYGTGYLCMYETD